MKLRGEYVLIIVVVVFCSNAQYSMYDNDCLDYYATDYDVNSMEIYISKRDEHQIVPFCRDDDKSIENNVQVKFASMTFEELNNRNITGLQLYSWSIHMDLIEEYQAYRHNNKTTASNSTIYNCSAVHKFGLYCQYSFNTKVFTNRQLIDERIFSSFVADTIQNICQRNFANKSIASSKWYLLSTFEL